MKLNYRTNAFRCLLGCVSFVFFSVCLFFSPSIFGATEHFGLDCFVDVGSKGLTHISRCAMSRRDGTLKVAKNVLRLMSFDDDGLSAMNASGCYWVNRLGVAKKTYCFDNGADYFVEGLTRYVAPDGKFGFMDNKLRIVVQPAFDFVFPFENGKARYCQGCKEVRDGEHSYMSGGKWGYVDRFGKTESE